MNCQTCGHVLGCENCDYLIPEVKPDIVVWYCTVREERYAVATFHPDVIYSATIIHLDACPNHSSVQKMLNNEKEMHAQLCPKCRGQGVVGVPPGEPGIKDEYGNISFIASQTSWTCDLCKGKMYILL